MKNQPNQSGQTLLENTIALRAAIILLVASLVVTITYGVLAYQLSAWQMYVLSGVIGAYCLVLLLSMRLIRNHKASTGIWLILVALDVIFFVANGLIAGIGGLFAVSLVLLTSTVIGVTRVLSQKQGWQAIIASVVVGLMIIVLDVAGFAALNVTYRLTVPPQLQTLIPWITGVVVIIYGVIILRRFNQYSLRVKFIFTFMALALIPLGLLAYVNNVTIRQRLVENANQNLLVSARQEAGSIDNFIANTLNTVEAEAGLPGFATLLAYEYTLNRTNQQLVVSNLARKAPDDIISYAVLNSDGVNIVDSRPDHSGEIEIKQPYFQIPFTQNKPYVSPVYFMPGTDEPVIYFSVPIHNSDEQTIGVLRVIYRASVLQQLLEGTAGENVFAVLFDENRLHLAHSDPEIAPLTNYRLTALPDEATLRELQAQDRLPVITSLTDLSTDLPALDQNLANINPENPYFEAIDKTSLGTVVNQVAVAQLGEQPWLLAVFQPQELLFEAAEDQTQTSLLLVVIIGLVTAVAAVLVSQQFVRPITRLTEAATQISAGDLTVQTSVESADEIGQLAQAFNTMAQQLQQVVGTLEEQVNERTAALATSMEVGQQAAAIRELDELLPTIVEFIRSRFNLYYVHVYMKDDVGKNLNIMAGTGQVGRELLARNYTLPVGAGSMVGQVAATAQSIVVSNTKTSLIHRPNPLLPDTRSELAVPLVIERQVIGVLDMQSDQVDTFTEDNLTVFEAMATQLAISIDSAQQWAASIEAQQRSEQAIRRLTKETWSQELQRRKVTQLGYHYNLSDVRPLTGHAEKEDISAPVVVQNQPIGRLSIAMPDGKTATGDELALLQAVALQLAQKAENLRLFDETQQRATREQVARQITDRIRSSRDIETALKTAAEELGKALGVTRTAVDLQFIAEGQPQDQE